MTRLWRHLEKDSTHVLAHIFGMHFLFAVEEWLLLSLFAIVVCLPLVATFPRSLWTQNVADVACVSHLNCKLVELLVRCVLLLTIMVTPLSLRQLLNM